jgi:hypothetical protein
VLRQHQSCPFAKDFVSLRARRIGGRPRSALLVHEIAGALSNVHVNPRFVFFFIRIGQMRGTPITFITADRFDPA